VHNETEKDQVIDDWIQWIVDHVKLTKNKQTEYKQATQIIQSSVNVDLV
jgi:hypothetical protein